MTDTFEDVDLDKLVHEPSRLVILNVLMSCEQTDFLFVQRLSGLSKGNLSNHLTKLEEGGLVLIEKTFVGKKPRTYLRITEKGRVAVEHHWQQLERIRKGINTNIVNTGPVNPESVQNARNP
jgi:DNA-binding MarR family transcriptional regulator